MTRDELSIAVAHLKTIKAMVTAQMEGDIALKEIEIATYVVAATNLIVADYISDLVKAVNSHGS